jgi:hypothetical protein
MTKRLHLPLLCLFVALCVETPARAQSDAERKAAAEALFDEGRRLVETGDLSAACTKFEQSEALDSAPGTLLNLADCYERAGRLASAWATFKRAAAAARTRAQVEREGFARERAAALEPRLSRLTIDVPTAARVAGLTITRDEAPVLEALWGQAVPVDGGTLVVRVSAPGRVAWEQQVVLSTERAAASITVPVLPEVGAATSTSGTTATEPPNDAGPTPGTRRHEPLGTYLLGGLGAVTLVTGGVLGGVAASTNAASTDHCSATDENLCSARGVTLRDHALSYGNASTVLVPLGVAGLVGATIVHFTARGPREAAARDPRALVVGASSTVAGDGLSLQVSGRW